MLSPAGKGCVGAVSRYSSCGTGRSSIGTIGSPVSRSNRKRWPSARIAATALRVRPSIPVS